MLQYIIVWGLNYLLKSPQKLLKLLFKKRVAKKTKATPKVKVKPVVVKEKTKATPKTKIKPVVLKAGKFIPTEAFLEAQEVLSKLGYGKRESKQVLINAIAQAINKDDSEELLQFALQGLSSN